MSGRRSARRRARICAFCKMRTAVCDVNDAATVAAAPDPTMAVVRQKSAAADLLVRRSTINSFGRCVGVRSGKFPPKGRWRSRVSRWSEWALRRWTKEQRRRFTYASVCLCL